MTIGRVTLPRVYAHLPRFEGDFESNRQHKKPKAFDGHTNDPYWLLWPGMSVNEKKELVGRLLDYHY